MMSYSITIFIVVKFIC